MRVRRRCAPEAGTGNSEMRGSFTAFRMTTFLLDSYWVGRVDFGLVFASKLADGLFELCCELCRVFPFGDDDGFAYADLQFA
jgi:hypothetical protein